MEIANYFKIAIEKNASDLHLVSSCVPTLRINGGLVKIAEERIEDDELKEAVYALLKDKDREYFLKNKELDFSYEFSNERFRVNLHFQEGQIGLTARHIPSRPPTPKELNFTETIYKLTHLNSGLVLVTGPSGSGKSTTLACMIDIINQERRSHIITIEDPIEFLFKEKQSIIEQRELGRDTNSFSDSLKFALRQDPNVIMVGEMRDTETIAAALTAAETGHLVLSTLHTNSAPEAIDRIIASFPSHQQQLVLNQLASILRAIIAQQLLPGIDGGRIAAREILINNSAVANLIRENKISQIISVLQTSKKEGMITMDKAIDNLLMQQIISPDVANNRKQDDDTQAIYY